MIKKFENFEFNEDWEEEDPNSENEYVITDWYGYDLNEIEGKIYLFEKIIDDYNVIIYNNSPYDCDRRHYIILSEYELNNYIYNNKRKISICSKKNGYGEFEYVYFDELPMDIKNKILK